MYDENGDKITNANQKPFLERIFHDISATIPAKGTAENSNETLMTRERRLKELMNGTDEWRQANLCWK